MATVVLTDMKPRLTTAAEAVKSARDALGAEVETRDALVVAAVDHGMSLRAVAAAAGISCSRVIAIMATPRDDD